MLDEYAAGGESSRLPGGLLSRTRGMPLAVAVLFRRGALLPFPGAARRRRIAGSMGEPYP